MIKAENRTQTFCFLCLCSSHDPFGVPLLLYFVLIMVKIRHISAHDRFWLIISWIWLEQNSFSVRNCLRVNHYSTEIFLLPSTDPVTVTRRVSPVFFSALQGGVLQVVLRAHSSFWGSVECSSLSPLIIQAMPSIRSIMTALHLSSIYPHSCQLITVPFLKFS